MTNVNGEVEQKPAGIKVRESAGWELFGQTASAAVIAGCSIAATLLFHDPTVTASIAGLMTAFVGLAVYLYRALHLLDKHDKMVVMADACPDDVAKVVK